MLEGVHLRPSDILYDRQENAWESTHLNSTSGLNSFIGDCQVAIMADKVDMLGAWFKYFENGLGKFLFNRSLFVYTLSKWMFSFQTTDKLDEFL